MWDIIKAGTRAGFVAALLSSCGGLGMFEGETNVGDAPLEGSVQYRAGSDTYRVTGSGADI